MLKEIMPSGIKVLSGGTRIWPKFDRPWQADLDVLKPEPFVCPLEIGDRSLEIARFDYNSGWRIRKNRYTPYNFHVLVIPETCQGFSKGYIRTLGGLEGITGALKTISYIVTQQSAELFVAVHVGPGAGQNQWHLHWHVYDQELEETELRQLDATEEYFRSSSLVLTEEPMKIIMGGTKAGQCFFFGHRDSSFESAIGPIALTIHRLAVLYAEKFRSEQGLPPDYSVGLRISQQKNLRYGTVIPILNNAGVIDLLSITEGTRFSLPWSHEVTLAHLRG